MDAKDVKSEEIDEIINKLRDEGDRLRRMGQQMIDTSNDLNEIVYYYGHTIEDKKDKTSTSGSG